MSALQINHGIIFSKRQELSSVIKQELKRNKVQAENQSVIHSVSECLELIQKLDHCLLFLDWDMGADKLQEVLCSAERNQKKEIQPSFVIASLMETEIVSLCAEYGVNKVHVGEVSANLVRGIISEILNEYKNLSPFKQLLIKSENAKKKGDWEISMIILGELYNKAPKNTKIVTEYANCLIEQNLWQEAYDILKGFEDNPKEDPRILHLLARVYMHKKEDTKALKALEGAQILSPYNIDRLVTIGEIFLKQFKPENAEISFQSVLEIDGESVAGKNGKSTSMLLMGEVNEALTLLNSSSKREIASVFNNAAILAVKNKKHEQAIKLYDSALLAIGRNDRILAKLYFNKGIGFTKWKKIDPGVECFEKAITLDPKLINASYNIKALSKIKTSTSPSEGDSNAAEDLFSVSSLESDPLNLNFEDDFEEEIEVE